MCVKFDVSLILRAISIGDYAAKTIILLDVLVLRFIRLFYDSHFQDFTNIFFPDTGTMYQGSH